MAQLRAHLQPHPTPTPALSPLDWVPPPWQPRFPLLPGPRWGAKDGDPHLSPSPQLAPGPPCRSLSLRPQRPLCRVGAAPTPPTARLPEGEARPEAVELPPGPTPPLPRGACPSLEAFGGACAGPGSNTNQRWDCGRWAAGLGVLGRGGRSPPAGEVQCEGPMGWGWGAAAGKDDPAARLSVTGRTWGRPSPPRGPAWPPHSRAADATRPGVRLGSRCPDWAPLGVEFQESLGSCPAAAKDETGLRPGAPGNQLPVPGGGEGDATLSSENSLREADGHGEPGFCWLPKQVSERHGATAARGPAGVVMVARPCNPRARVVTGS